VPGSSARRIPPDPRALPRAAPRLAPVRGPRRELPPPRSAAATVRSVSRSVPVVFDSTASCWFLCGRSFRELSAMSFGAPAGRARAHLVLMHFRDCRLPFFVGRSAQRLPSIRLETPPASRVSLSRPKIAAPAGRSPRAPSQARSREAPARRGVRAVTAPSLGPLRCARARLPLPRPRAPPRGGGAPDRSPSSNLCGSNSVRVEFGAGRTRCGPNSVRAEHGAGRTRCGPSSVQAGLGNIRAGGFGATVQPELDPPSPAHALARLRGWSGPSPKPQTAPLPERRPAVRAPASNVRPAAHPDPDATIHEGLPRATEGSAWVCSLAVGVTRTDAPRYGPRSAPSGSAAGPCLPWSWTRLRFAPWSGAERLRGAVSQRAWTIHLGSPPCARGRTEYLKWPLRACRDRASRARPRRAPRALSSGAPVLRSPGPPTTGPQMTGADMTHATMPAPTTNGTG
jgi:hypothetical protein